jgi:N-acetylmuramic acid 6-phosphate etherase
MNTLFQEIAALPTEQRNTLSQQIDTASVEQILHIINDEDARVAPAVRAEIPQIAQAVEHIVTAFRNGGRLIYCGAGTSGRLGIVDASECPPTYGTPPELVQAMIAGGREAVFQAQEGAEDKPDEGAREVREKNVSANDVVCGIAASGRTPYVLGALREAHSRGATTVMVTTNHQFREQFPNEPIDIVIAPNIGAEVVTGSTRMKSGTAQKLILNMLTTAAMIRLGKVYGNVMVDLQMTNLKLRERAKRVVMEVTGVGYDEAVRVLEECGGHVKTAIVMLLAGVDKHEALHRLEQSQGFVRPAIEQSATPAS